MNCADVMRQLESMGAGQNRKIYKRHGAGDSLYGVSFANLEKLRKQIKVDHSLAQELWATGNTDARTLAVMIASPAAASEQMLERWARDLDYYCLVDVFVKNLASRTPFARKKMEQWTKSGQEWIGRAGWLLLATLAMSGEPLPDRYFEAYIARIERSIHSARNRTKDAMNSALIAIGIRNAALREKALAAAGKIGKVQVDHGQTGCKTPDAAAYILKATERKKARTRKARVS